MHTVTLNKTCNSPDPYTTNQWVRSLNLYIIKAINSAIWWMYYISQTTRSVRNVKIYFRMPIRYIGFLFNLGKPSKRISHKSSVSYQSLCHNPPNQAKPAKNKKGINLHVKFLKNNGISGPFNVNSPEWKQLIYI